jgi:3-polyprenyl-4-hydroxybenzoate decarboxylase
MPGLGIDPSATQSVSSGGKALITRTSKIGIDATKPLDEAERFERIRIPPHISRKIAAVLKGEDGEKRYR